MPYDPTCSCEFCLSSIVAALKEDLEQARRDRWAQHPKCENHPDAVCACGACASEEWQKWKELFFEFAEHKDSCVKWTDAAPCSCGLSLRVKGFD